MINPTDSLQYSNVVSRKVNVHISEMKEALGTFLDDVKALGATFTSYHFYSQGVPTKEGRMLLEFFVPIAENYLTMPESLDFHTYFEIQDMISTTIISDFETKTEIAYSELLIYMEQLNLQQTTPFFNVFLGDETLQYVIVKVGAMEKQSPNELQWK